MLNRNSLCSSTGEGATLHSVPKLEDRPPLAPRSILSSGEVEIIEVRQRGRQLVWTIECKGQHYETSLRALKRRAPDAVIDFLVANLKV